MLFKFLCLLYILLPMHTDILITDARLKFSLSLADFLRVQGKRVILTSDTERIKEKKQEDTIGPVLIWNRQSIFSLQSLPLQCKNLQVDIETAIFVFDASAYADLYTSADAVHTDSIITELVTAHIQLVYVLMQHIMQKKSGKLMFIHRDVPASCKNIPVIAASGAFMRMAEAAAAVCAQEEPMHLQTMLARLEGEDNALAIEWVAAQINQPILSRSFGKWVKAGQRGLFERI